MLTFEQFLQKQWPAEGVLDDAMETAFYKWLDELQVDELIDYGDEYGAYILDFCTTQLTKMLDSIK